MITFNISDEEEAASKIWIEEHRRICQAKPDVSNALYYWTIYPTGIGTAVTINCPCGAKCDVTYYDAW